MYFEEQIINGILCWRDTPNGKWNQYSIGALSNMVKDLRGATMLYSERMVRCISILQGKED